MPTPAVISTPYVRGDDRDATGETPPPANRSCGSLLRQWWKESLWPGMGLFGESYLLFSIGTLTPIWKELYPLCFRGEEDAYAQDDTYAQDDAYAYAYEYAHNDGTCSPWLLPSLTYGVVLGVIAGMVLLGYGSDRIGRRKGSILTASLMVAGSLGLVGVSLFGSEDTWTAESVFRGTVASLVVFGIGVGGEYPLSAGLASEQGAATTTHNKNLSNNNNTDHHRGRRVQLVFAMQGLGIWFNSLVMLVLFWILRGQPGYGDNDDNNDGEQHEYEYLYQAHDLVTIWRVTYGIGASVLCFVLVSRILYLEESKVWLEAQESHANTKNQSAAISDATDLTTDLATDHLPSHNSSSSSSSSNNNNPAQYNHEQHPDTDSFLPAVDAKTRFRLVHQQYGSRLFGAGTAWLLWDVSFYGNKLFQSTFLEVLVGGDANDTPSPVRLTQAALINATVALTGYYGAAALIDATVPSSSSGCGCGSDPHLRRRLLGRTQLQTLGFLANGMLFVACGYLVASSGSSSITTVVLYCLSSFVGQLGPNCTTFLIPAEILPTDQRTYGHGVCAAAGKIGALVAAVVFHGMMNAHAHAHNAHQERLFYLSGACSLLAAAVTHGFVPESSGLELCELDRQWKLLLQTQTQQQQQQQQQTQTQQQQQQQQQEQKLKDECETPFNYDGPASHPDHMSLYERYCQRQNERQKLPTENSPRHLLDGWFA